jgi:hypothetical protein
LHECLQERDECPAIRIDGLKEVGGFHGGEVVRNWQWL